MDCNVLLKFIFWVVGYTDYTVEAFLGQSLRHRYIAIPEGATLQVHVILKSSLPPAINNVTRLINSALKNLPFQENYYMTFIMIKQEKSLLTIKACQRTVKCQ